MVGDIGSATRTEVLGAIRNRYREASKKEKGMGFDLIIVPTNGEAKNFALGSVGPMEVTLTDNLGEPYSFNGSSTGTVEAASGIEVDSQQFNFHGELAPAATSLKLTIEGGGGEVVGPFVFDGIELAPMDAPQ